MRSLWKLNLSNLLCVFTIFSTADMLINSYVNKLIIHPEICAAVSSRTVGHHCSLTRPYHSAMALRGRKVFGIEVDPGDIKGTKLKVLKYPHPKV